MKTLAWVLALQAVTASASAARGRSLAPRRSPTARLAMSADVTLEVVSDYATIKVAADFFARTFWPADLDLSGSQMAQLEEQHRADFDLRYGALTGKRRFPSLLLVARDGADEIVGTAGVEMTIVDPGACSVWDRAQAEGLFAERLGAMGGRERNQYRKAELPELASVFLQGQGQAVRPVLSNLAVSRAYRGTGLGQRLIAECEARIRNAGSWTGEDLWLLVEQGNEPAVKLYTRVGFETVWRTERMATRVAGAAGALQLNQEATLVLAMAKRLRE